MINMKATTEKVRNMELGLTRNVMVASTTGIGCRTKLQAKGHTVNIFLDL